MHDFFMVLLFGAVILGPLVFVHELGHFLVAKWLGVRVLSFSIGMGPRLFGFRRGDTDYRISVLPLGGFVRMAGDTPEAEEREGQPYEFLEKPWWARALITAAGPIANLVFAFLLYGAVYAAGVQVRDFPAVVGRVAPGTLVEKVGVRDWDRIVSFGGRPAGTLHQLDDAIDQATRAKQAGPIPMTVLRGGKKVTLAVPRAETTQLIRELDWNSGTVLGRVFVALPAYQAGLREGDEILAVNGQRVENWSQLSSRIRKNPDTPLTLQVRRGAQRFQVTVRTTTEGMIGISLPETTSVVERAPVPQAAWLGLKQTLSVAGQIYAGLWGFVTNPVRLSSSVAGPIAIAQVARDQARSGLDQLLSFAAFISVALMAMNLLPIPILDGGHIFFALLEGARRRPLSLKTQAAFQRVGLAVLGGLIIFSFANDLTRVSQRRRAEEEIQNRLNRSAPADTAGSPDGR